jgi:hypothetical protein
MADDTADPASPTRARAIPTVEERIDHIVGMMERFEWVRGKSAPMLAAEWGLATNTVEHAAAEASRRCTGDADEARRDISMGARRLLRKAIQDEDDKAFKNVADVWAMVSGAKAPEKIDARVANVGLDDLDALRKSAEANADDECPTEPEPPSNGPGQNS